MGRRGAPSGQWPLHDDVLLMFVTGYPPPRGGGGIPRRPCDLFSRMGVGIVRTVTRFSASPDTDAEKPGLHVAPFPHASPGLFSFTLRIIVLSL